MSPADFRRELARRKAARGLSADPSCPSPGNHLLGATPDGQEVRLSADGRRAHTHILGGSGRGKSYFLQHLIRQDFDDPDCGLCLLDPHGSLYRPLVQYLSQERPDLAERVVLFDPAGDGEQVLGFNPIGNYAAAYPEYALNMLVGACLKAWGQDRTDRTPRIRRWLENIFAPIIVNDLTLIETAPLLATSKHSDKRALLLAALDNELIREDWEGFEGATSTVRQQLLEGSGNRLRKFLSNPLIRQVLGQQQHTLDIDRVLAEKKILLVNLAPGMGIDRENANLLGILLINELCRAAMLRDPDTSPHPFFLYIDEFAQLITPTVANILDECRKYGLFLTLAHQHLAQLKKEDETLYASVLTNCHNRVVFGGLSIEDAELLSRQLFTGFEDLKQVKHTSWQTKFRPVEEVRTVVSESHGKNRGSSEMFTDSYGETDSHTHSLAEAISQGRSRSIAHNSSWAISISRTVSAGESASEGGQESQGKSEEQGVSRTRNWSNGESEQTGESSGLTRSHQQSEQSGQNEQEQIGRSTLPDGSTLQRQQSGSEGTNLTRGESDTESSQEQRSHGRSSTHQEGGSEALTRSQGKSRQRGQNWSLSQSHSVADQQGHSRGGGRSMSEGEQEGQTRTETDAKGKSKSRQQSRGQGRQESTTESVSESRVPFHRMEEFQEGQQVFWSLGEIEHHRIGQLKELPVGRAVMKLGAVAPVQVKVGRLTAPPLTGQAAGQALQTFTTRVAEAHSEFYATPAMIQAEISTRQTAVFGEVMRLNLTPADRPQKAIEIIPPGLPTPQTEALSRSSGFDDGDDDTT